MRLIYCLAHCQRQWLRLYYFLLHCINRTGIILLCLGSQSVSLCILISTSITFLSKRSSYKMSPTALLRPNLLTVRWLITSTNRSSSRNRRPFDSRNFVPTITSHPLQRAFWLTGTSLQAQILQAGGERAMSAGMPTSRPE